LNRGKDKPVNKFVCFAAGKGGVGKSIIAANVAYAAAKLTKGRVIAISADPGSKTLEYLVEGGFKPDNGWVEFLNDEDVHINEVMIKSKLADNLYVVYSSTKRAFYSESNASVASLKLTRLINGWNSDPGISLVVVDTAAGRTKDHLVYASVFDTYLVTTHSRVDLKAAEEFRNVLNRRMFELFKVGEEVIRGAVVNMATSKNDIKEVRSYLELPILGAIPYSNKMEEANKNRLPIMAFDHDDKASKAMKEMARKILQVMSLKISERDRLSKNKYNNKKNLMNAIQDKIRNILENLFPHAKQCTLESIKVLQV
jgi:MinD-like ATPase involved in chromosome partitioning or flagellar assembly